MGADPAKLLTASELSAHVRHSVWTIYRWTKKKQIPSYSMPAATPGGRRTYRYNLGEVLAKLRASGRSPSAG